MLVNKDNGGEYVFRGIPVFKLVVIILLNVILVPSFLYTIGTLGMMEVMPIMMVFCLDFYLWGCIKYPEQIIINRSGITYHERNFSFFRGFAITTYFYSWSDISKVSMTMEGGGKHTHYYLLLIDANQQEIKISLESVRYSEDDIFEAVRNCCPGRDIVDLASWRKKKKEAYMTGIAVAVVAIALIIIMYFVSH